MLSNGTMIKTLFILLSLFTYQHFSFAAEKIIPFKPIQNSITKRLQKNGNNEYFVLNQYFNEHNEKEIAISHQEFRKFAPDSEVTLLYGRDLDGDGFYDTWMYRNQDGVIDAVEMPAYSEDGWDSASIILNTYIDYSDRWISGIIMSNILHFVSFTADTVSKQDAKLDRQEMDLQDLYIRLEHSLKKSGSDTEEYKYISNLIDLHFKSMMGSLSFKQTLKDCGLLVIDAGIFFFGGELMKSANALLRSTFKTFSKMTSETLVMKVIDKYTDAFAKKAVKQYEKLGIKKAVAKFLGERAALVATENLLKKPVAQQVDITIRALISRERMFALIGKSLKTVAKTAKGGFENWRYILAVQSIQIAAEIHDKHDEIYDPNPIIMAKNAVSNKGIIQDVAFMSNETFWMSGIAATVKSTPKALLIGGLFSFFDSTLMNVLVKHEADTGRINLDTRWEMSIGNDQTQLDFYSTRYFENLASKTGYKPLRFLGWAAVAIDQGIGYMTYASFSRQYEEEKKKANNSLWSEDDIILIKPNHRKTDPNQNKQKILVKIRPVFVSE